MRGASEQGSQEFGLKGTRERMKAPLFQHTNLKCSFNANLMNSKFVHHKRQIWQTLFLSPTGGRVCQASYSRRIWMFGVTAPTRFSRARLPPSFEQQNHDVKAAVRSYIYFEREQPELVRFPPLRCLKPQRARHGRPLPTFGEVSDSKRVPFLRALETLLNGQFGLSVRKLKKLDHLITCGTVSFGTEGGMLSDHRQMDLTKPR